MYIFIYTLYTNYIIYIYLKKLYWMNYVLWMNCNGSCILQMLYTCIKLITLMYYSTGGDSISNLPKSLSKTELLCSCREGIIYVKKTHEWQNLLNEYRTEILKLRECLKDRPRSSRGKFKVNMLWQYF